MGADRHQAGPLSLDCLRLETRALILVFDPGSLALLAANAPARSAFNLGEDLPGAAWLKALVADGPRSISIAGFRRLRSGQVQRGRLTVRLEGRPRLLRLEARSASQGRPFLVVELTEVVEDEEAITGVAASAKRFKALLEGIADAYYDWHILTDFVEPTAPLDLMLGLEPGGLPRTSVGFRERIHPDDREQVIAANQSAVARGAPYVGEYRMRREDGSYVLVQDRGIVISGEDGTPTHQVGTIRDVTRERQAEQALRDSRELYRTLFSTAANPAYRVDAEGIVLDANPAGLELLGAPESAVIGTNMEQLFPKEFTDAVRQSLVTESVLKREAELHREDRRRHLLFTIVPCEVGGDSFAFLLGTDVTPLFRDLRGALKESEGALRQQAELLEQRNAALAVTLDQMHNDRQDLEQTVIRNLEQFVLPTLERTRRSLGLRPEAAQLDALSRSLREIGRPLLGLPASNPPEGGRRPSFTRRETEVLNLIRAGKTTAEIAESLYLSPATVTFHRRSIRRKLGLGRGESRLDTYFFGG
jgi:PAS domain S-box-containing protein